MRIQTSLVQTAKLFDSCHVQRSN